MTVANTSPLCRINGAAKAGDGAAGVAAFTAASGSVKTTLAPADDSVSATKLEAPSSNDDASGAVLGDFLLASLVGLLSVDPDFCTIARRSRIREGSG